MTHPLELFDHPLELTIRRAYHSYDCGNMDGFLEACSELQRGFQLQRAWS